MALRVLFARFPFGGSEHPDVADWLVPTVLKAKRDPRISDVYHMRVDDTPITLSRNRVLKECLAKHVDIVCMIDSDMSPDLAYPGCKPFWDSSFDFMVKHQGPCVVAAPYCGPPPFENTYQFYWASQQNDNPNCDITALRLEQYSREDAARRIGIQEAAALPTGLILIDLKALQYLTPPWFEYEYEDPPFNTKKATTEDVFFTRNLSLAGVPQYVNWDAWAGHHKRKRVDKPQILTADAVRDQFREALLRGKHSEDRVIEVKPEGVNGHPIEIMEELAHRTRPIHCAAITAATFRGQR